MEQSFPTTVEHYLKGVYVPHDQIHSVDEPPSWVDKDRFRRGQNFVKKHFSGVVGSHALGQFYAVFWMPVFRVLSFFGKYDKLGILSRLSLSLISHIITWYEGDIWNPDDPAYKSMKHVQQLHGRLGRYANKHKERVDRSKLDTSKEPEIFAKCNFAQFVRKDFEALGHRYSSTCPVLLPGEGQVYMSQMDLATVTIGLISAVMIAPEKIGIHGATEEEVGDFVHMWRVLAYHLGVQDRYNPCAGSASEVRSLVWSFMEKLAIPNMKNLTQENEFFLWIVLKSYRHASPIFGIFSDSVEMIFAYMAWMLNLTDLMHNTNNNIPWLTWMGFQMLKFWLYVACRVKPVARLFHTLTEAILIQVLKSTGVHSSQRSYPKDHTT